MPTDLGAASNELHDATPASWRVGRPAWNDRLKVCEIYAYVLAETRRGVGHRVSGRTAVGDSELDVVREMARCLREIREGRVPQ